jgi:hypothetical protein
MPRLELILRHSASADGYNARRILREILITPALQWRLAALHKIQPAVDADIELGFQQLSRPARPMCCHLFAGRPLLLYVLQEEPSWSAALPRLVVVSNRVSVPDAAGKGTAGGLAVALREAFRAYQGLWFGWSGKVASQPASQPRMVDKGRVQYALMDLTSLDRREYYNGFANRAL